MKRRHFLGKGLMAAFAVSIFGFSTKEEEQPQPDADCETSNDILGPFYRPKAPLVQDLTFEGLEGNRILIKGVVRSDDCETPLKDAVVEIWHCDTEGNYDNDSDAFWHRARQKTDKEGNYSFLTILPGKYLNGKQFRPSHIHFRVTAKGHQELISQIYFEGDPHIEDDPWASQSKAVHRVLPLRPENTIGGLTVPFDIGLQKI